MLLAHKIELRPTSDQAQFLDRACGSTRHLYNHLLAHFNQDGVKWSKKEAREQFYALRNEFEWYGDISADFMQSTIDDLECGFKNFFSNLKKGKKAGYPKFKKRGVKDSCSIRNKPKFSVSNDGLRFEKFNKGMKCQAIAMREKLRFAGTTKQMTISKRSGKYFVSILVETEDYNPKDTEQSGSVGVDFGIKDLAILSSGKVFAANQKLKQSLKKLKRKQRSLSRKVRGSNRYAKAKQAVAKLHYRIANQRLATCHEVSDYLTKTFKLITIEDLNVAGMVKSHKLARSVSDCGFFMLRGQIEYKAKLRNCEVVIADRWFPSSKTCSCCGHKLDELPLSVRHWKCPSCLSVNDRDVNASVNLDKYGRDRTKLDLKLYKRAESVAA